ncbi:electron transport complex protein [Escherichia coli]|uniref:Electron transport complex protein n=1 Tax=Escherichia coli TaxID=562 RepID=A0A376P5V5_ECOLX|nr:electron transport complex protein [Escherichia coli]
MLAGKYLIDERMKKRRAEAAAERACQTVKQGMSDEQSKTPRDPTRLRENILIPPPSLISVRLLNC